MYSSPKMENNFNLALIAIIHCSWKAILSINHKWLSWT